MGLMDFDYNMDDERRAEILKDNFSPAYNKGRAINRFEYISLDQLRTLIDEKFADPRMRQNFAPSIQELVDFATKNEKYLKCMFDGYIVGAMREDYRVSIDTIHIAPKANLSNYALKVMETQALNLGKKADSKIFNGNEWTLCWN